MAENASVELLKLVSACHDLAFRAGGIVRDVYLSGDLQEVDKDPENATNSKSVYAKPSDNASNDPQTIADLKAQKFICGSLARSFSDVTLIGEEGELEVDEKETVVPNVEKLKDQLAGKIPSELERIPAADLTIWIDPLDGTREFTQGSVENVTILIGIARKGKPLAGFIGQPFKNYNREKHTAEPSVVWGVQGVGAFGYDKVADFPKPNARRFVLCSNSHFNDAIKAYCEQAKVEKVIRTGGCGGKFLKLLEGHADAYLNPSPGTKKWDTCAPHAVLAAAGGKVTLPDGSDLIYDNNDHPNAKGFIATLQGDHESYVVKKSNKL